MNRDAVRVNQVDLVAAFPSLRILESLRLAFSFRLLALAALCVAAFLPLQTADSESGISAPLPLISENLPAPLKLMMARTMELFLKGSGAGLTPVLQLIYCLVVTGLCGTAASRSAGTAFCRNQGTGLARSVQHALAKWRSIISSIALAMMIGLLLLVFYRGICMIARATAESPWIGRGSEIFLWSSTLAVMLSLALISLGWLLSLSGTGIDSCDGAEALSRGISYVLSRFWRIAAYATSMVFLIWFSTLVAFLLVSQAGLLAMQARHSNLDMEFPRGPEFEAFRWFVVETWKLSLTFSGATISYVLLRRFEDNTSLTATDLCDMGLQKPVTSTVQLPIAQTPVVQ